MTDSVEDFVMQQINVNAQVRAKLTDAGIRIMRENGEITKWEYDENTRTVRVPLWKLMRTFGNAMYMGCSSLPFERNEITVE
jgi:hypothetical protein